MQIIHNLEQLSEEHRALAQEVLGIIDYGRAAPYRELEPDHPVRYAAPVIKALVDRYHSGTVEDHVPQAAFEDPELVAYICTHLPKLCERIEAKIFTEHPQVVLDLIQNRPASLDYMSRAPLHDAFIDDVMRLPVFDPKAHWSMDVKDAARTALRRASSAFWTQDKAIALSAHVPEMVKDLAQFHKDVSVQLAVLRRLPDHYAHCSWEVRNDPTVLQQVLSKYGNQLEHAPWTVQSDPHWTQIAMNATPTAYLYVDHAIAVQPQVALGIMDRVRDHAYSLFLDAVPQRLRADIQWCHQLLDTMEKNKISASVAKYIDPSVLLNDGFTQRLCALQPQHLPQIHRCSPKGIWHLEEHSAKMCASNRLLLAQCPMGKDPEFCRKVLASALSDASHTRDVMKHIASNGIALESAYFVKILQQQPTAYVNFPQDIKCQPETVLALLKTGTQHLDTLRNALESLPATTFENNEALLHTFLDAFMTPSNPMTNPTGFRKYEIAVLTETHLVPDTWMNAIKNDIQTAERFVHQHPKLYAFLNDDLKANPELFECYLNATDGQLANGAFPEVLRNDPHYAMMAVQKNTENYFLLPAEMRQRPELAWQFATEHPYNLSYVPDAFAHNTEWVLKVCEKRKDAKMVEFASPSIKGLVTKTQRQLRQSDPQASLQDAALHLAAKRTAQSEQKALKTAFKEAPRPAARPVANRPMGRSL